MTLRIFLAAMMVLALALGPLAVPAAASAHRAMAAAPATHHGTMGDSMSGAGHCDEQQQPDRQDRQAKGDTGCCVASCTAVADLPAPARDMAPLPGLRERAAPDRFRLGHLGEIATPPPRAA